MRGMQSTGIPDADLVIRSGGGERRLSNFLLWQAAYHRAESFTDKLWPDFGAEDLEAALALNLHAGSGVSEARALGAGGKAWA